MSKAFDYLETLLAKHSLNHTQIAEELGITSQALQSWKTTNHIPSKRVSQLSDRFNLNNREIDILLGNDPLHICFRTKNGQELTENRVPEEVSVRAETIFERFFHADESFKIYDLSRLRKNILEVKDDFMQIAECIRLEFTIPKFKPLDMQGLSMICDRVKILSYFLPFKSLGLIGREEMSQTAILFEKGDFFAILIDSDRNIDEAHFDQLHELIHIFFKTINFGIDDTALENLIDKVCGELIYPKDYILERFFDGDSNSKPITNPDLLKSKFIEDSENYIFTISPKGLARSMRESGLASEQTQLFKFLSTQLHEEFRNNAINYSTLGKMDRDFSNPNQMLDFYKHVEKRAKKTRYPLFEKIKKDVLTEQLSVSDFADTFSMDNSDALMIKAMWEKETSSDV